MTPDLSMGAESASGAVASDPDASSPETSLPRSIRNFATGPPSRLATIRPIVATAVPVSTAGGNPCSRAIAGAHAIVVPCPPTRAMEPHDHAGRRGQAEQRSAEHSNHVLHENVDRCQHAKDNQRLAAGKQIGQPGVDANRREEDDQQFVTGNHLEADGPAGYGMKYPQEDCCKKSAGHRLRDVVIGQKRNVSRHDHAHEINDETEGESQEIRSYKRIGGGCHDDLAK
jgi:hypothetical protein